MEKTRQKIAFQNAVSRLNSKNLEDLWLTHSLLSLHDYYAEWEGDQNILYPMLNMQRISMFGTAILASKAMSYKEKQFTSQDLARVFNNLSQAESWPDPSEVDDATFAALRMLSVLASAQFRFSENILRERLGRVYYMLEVLPVKYHDVLGKNHGSRFVDTSVVFKQHHGISISDFLLCGFIIIALHGHMYKGVYKPDEHAFRHVKEQLRTTIGMDILERVFGLIVDGSKGNYRNLMFDVKELESTQLSYPEGPHYQAFLNLISKTTKELRSLQRLSPFNVGYQGFKISPLRRYPIVRFENGVGYTVPNFRFLEHGIVLLPHFILQAAFPNNEYNETRGSLQELYIQDLTNARLPHLVTIPEIKYRHSKGEFRGPDLTIIEDGRLIVLESKARQIRAETHVDPLSDSLLVGLQGAVSALKRLPLKINHLFEGRPEYAHMQDLINSTRTSDPLCVVIVGEGVFGMAEAIQLLLERDPEHFLHTLKRPYAIMDLGTFERAVEVAASSVMSLYDLLMEYWQDSITLTPKDHPAEEFRGRGIDQDNRFSRQYVNRLFSKVKGIGVGTHPPFATDP